MKKSKNAAIAQPQVAMGEDTVENRNEAQAAPSEVLSAMPEAQAQAPSTTPEAQAEAPSTTPKAPRVTIASIIIADILNTTKSNEEILKHVHEKVPTAKTTYACVAWYRTKLRKEGKIPARTFNKQPQSTAPEPVQQAV